MVTKVDAASDPVLIVSEPTRGIRSQGDRMIPRPRLSGARTGTAD
jgi:hypothetical protein